MLDLGLVRIETFESLATFSSYRFFPLHHTSYIFSISTNILHTHVAIYGSIQNPTLTLLAITVLWPKIEGTILNCRYLSNRLFFIRLPVLKFLRNINIMNGGLK
jgi:hypothetical protein